MPEFETIEERRAFLAQVAEVQYQWEMEVAAQAPFHPRGDDSDYNLHNADIDALAEQEQAQWQAWAEVGIVT